MITFNYENIKKAYKKHLFEQEVKAFLKKQYGIEEKPKIKPKEIKKPEIKKDKTTNFEFNQELSLEEKISDLNEFLQSHSKRVGKEQCIKDFQRGLNILNKYSKDSSIKEKNKIKEDGVFGGITKATLRRICKSYSLYIIKKSIRTGAFNNAYAKSCRDKRVNPEKEIKEISKNLNHKESL
ncbi:MAG: hypothetical protein OIF36_04105 [Alphaproteobacteria bacterium]|nr:hypothetical protein [Alphaproteobacteria bacterium]